MISFNTSPDNFNSKQQRRIDNAGRFLRTDTTYIHLNLIIWEKVSQNILTKKYAAPPVSSPTSPSAKEKTPFPA